MRVRSRALAAPIAIVAAALALSVSNAVVAHPAARAATSAVSAGGSAAASAVTVSKPATRTFTDATGATSTVDQRTVTATVSQTQDLRDQQVVSVSWSGAHPTGGITPDSINWPDGGPTPWGQEYPFVLMQCRGVDNPSAPAAQQLSQQTCWTQYQGERTADLGGDYAPWQLDSYASAADRTVGANKPANVPATCSVQPAHWLPFVGVDGTVYPAGGSGCGDIPPEGSPLPIVPPQPSNTIYGVTDNTGHGSANFEVRSSATNSSLGCSESVPCSLVMVPIEGISCDARLLGQDPDGASTGADPLSRCRSNGAFAAGQRLQSAGGASQQLATGSGVSVRGSYWWSASNWRNRISVPLTLLPAGNFCDIHDSRTPVDVYGSELLGDATLSWSPTFCANPALFHFRHAKVGEPTAKNLLEQGTVNAAFVSAPPPGGYLTPTVNAPVAVSGFAIAFSIDGQDGRPIQNLKLTPRLLAKLLTNSYPGVPTTQQTNVALSHNPLNISYDPEFQALNPGVPLANFGGGSQSSAAVLSYLASQSDVMSALTAYINADPEARSWLDGRPDPWGMVVNPAYAHISLPVQTWTLRDTFIDPILSSDRSSAASVNPHESNCWFDDKTAEATLLSAPTSTLAAIVPAVRYASPASLTQCVDVSGAAVPLDKASFGFKPYGPEPAGSRFVLGLVGTADASLYGLPVAALQTQVLPTAAAKFTDAGGRSFVGPSEAAMRAAAALLVPDPSTNTWPIPYAALHTAAGAQGAYPGLMVIYMSVPTTGVDATDATDLAKLLHFTSTDGQVQGSSIGQLPLGYLPMTSANGLGSLAAYALVAAGAVSGQTGVVPPVVAVAGTAATTAAPSTPGTHASTTAAATAAGPSAAPGTAPAVAGAVGAAAPAAGSPAAESVPGTTPAATAPASGPTAAATPALAAAQMTSGVPAGLAGWLLPLLLAVLLAGLLYLAIADRRRPVVASA